MSKIALYIAPFALESPFDFIISDTSLYSSTAPGLTNHKLNNLVKELQDVWKNQNDLPNGHYFPEDLKWVLFCPARMTFLCRGNYSQLFLEQSGEKSAGAKHEKYIVVPEVLALRSDFLAQMRELIPSQVPYITYEEALKADRELCPQKFNRHPSVAPGSSCSHYAERLFHTKGVHNPTAGIYSNYHLAIWIPGTTLPWDVLLPAKCPSGARYDPTPYITYAFKCARTAATSTDSDQHMLNELLSLGYYPTEQNWVLIDFETGSQIHKSSVSDLRIDGGATRTFMVGSVQCAPLAKKLLVAIKQYGAPQWPRFWEVLVSTQKPRVGHNGNDKKVPVWTPATSVASSEYGDESG